MKPPKSLRRLLCSCDGDRVWTDGRCTTCDKFTDFRHLSERQMYGVIRRLERKATNSAVQPYWNP